MLTCDLFLAKAPCCTAAQEQQQVNRSVNRHSASRPGGARTSDARGHLRVVNALQLLAAHLKPGLCLPRRATHQPRKSTLCRYALELHTQQACFTCTAAAWSGKCQQPSKQSGCTCCTVVALVLSSTRFALHQADASNSIGAMWLQLSLPESKGGHLAGLALVRVAAVSDCVAYVHSRRVLATCICEDGCTCNNPLPHKRPTISERALLHGNRKGTACSVALRMNGAAH